MTHFLAEKEAHYGEWGSGVPAMIHHRESNDGLSLAGTPPYDRTFPKETPAMDANATVVTPIRVRGYHLDGYGHVNNARYLEFLEEGRWDYFDRHPDLAEVVRRERLGFVVVNLNLDYRRPAVAGDDLEVVTSIAEIGTRRMRIRQRIRHAVSGRAVADADLTFLLMDFSTQRAVTIEGEVRDRLAALVVAS
ncbi:acyl-CoA thioesterase [Halomonas beimenensis]